MNALPRILESIKVGTTAALFLAGAGCWTPPSPEIPPLPPDFAPACEGPVYPSTGSLGYLGQCCDHVICRQPDASGVCPSDDGRSYGSGQCLCGAAAAQGAPKTQGPFSVDPAGPFAQERQAGPCCYVTRSIGCTGRPLRVEEDVRLAGVIPRGDWC